MHVPRSWFFRWAVVSVLCGLLAIVGLAGVAVAEDAAKPKAHSAQVRDALTAFGRSFRAKRPAERAKAVRELGELKDKKIAKRLLKCLRSERESEVLVAVFETLRSQSQSKSAVVPKLVKYLANEVAAERKRIARRDCGLLVNAKTGDVDIDSAEGKARVAAVRDRGSMLAALLQTLATLQWPVPKQPLDLTPLLLDPSDALVVAVLTRMGTVKDWAPLPEVLALYRMYPAKALWETGAVNNALGTPAQAKADWMVRFGHPDKQRARPQVFEAIRAMLLAVTGRKFDDPEALAAYLDTPEAKKRIAAR